MRSPYLAGPIAFGENFYGRKALLNHLLDPRQTCIHLVGHRRMGKSSVLLRLVDEADVDTVALFINLQGAGKQLVELGSELVEQIDEAQVRFPALEYVKREPVTDACAIIRSLATVAKHNHLSVLMLWDEGEQLLSMDNQALGCLRAALQGKPQLRTILAATQRLRRLIATYSGHTSAFLNGFAPVYLPPLNEAEAVELISQPRNIEGPVQVTKLQTSQIIELTGGQPYLIQVLCGRLFESSGHLRPITVDDLIVDEALDSYLQNDYEGLILEERTILKALAQQAAAPGSLAHTLQISPGSLDQPLHEMVQTGLLKRRNDTYQIANFFLQNWLATGRMRESDSPNHHLPADSQALQHQLDGARANLRLIEERISEYVLETDVPLSLIKDQRRWQDQIAYLERQLREA
jgi:hypothetical protein